MFSMCIVVRRYCKICGCIFYSSFTHFTISYFSVFVLPKLTHFDPSNPQTLCVLCKIVDDHTLLYVNIATTFFYLTMLNVYNSNKQNVSKLWTFLRVCQVNNVLGIVICSSLECVQRSLIQYTGALCLNSNQKM